MNLKKLIRGFTLIETMIAVSLLSIAIVAPMTLTMQSLQTAYYARDQMTASNLAQEAIESIRSIRDGNILNNAEGGATVNLLNGIPIGTDFTIDARNNVTSSCSGTCSPLQTDGNFYGYNAGWTNTNFTRTIHADYVPTPGVASDEIRVQVTVTWRTGKLQSKSLVLYENMYRWVADGSASG